jgi:TDG/mug DNA glycosylase family protein
MHVHSFSPLARPDARLLVLGSMPGKASLRATQYYAHPRNAFWKIIEALFAIPAELPYAERCARLTAHGVAVWDVLQSCTRQSSLDSDIVASSAVPNDFHRFLSDHPHIRAIAFNGQKAQQLFMRQVQPSLPPAFREIPTCRLPSTSPAHASLGFDAKLAHWQIVAQTVSTA